VNSLELGYGEDGPESMTRMLYESYADETIGWRDGSRKILVHFGDSVPHDDDLNEGIGGDVYSTGGDPGRDAVMFTEDDLDLQTVLAGMAENNIQLLNCLSYGTENEFWDYWVYWAGLTGGECYEATGEKLPTQVIDAISLSLTAPTVSGLTLVPEEADFEPWIAGLSEPYSGPTGVDIPLTVTLKRPDGIPAGIYTFHMNAVDALGVEYGLYEFVITCNDIIEMYTIVFNAAGGTGGETIEVADGETPVPPAVEKEGFDFIGWEPAVVPAAADATYTAQWQETVPGVTWQITFDAAGGTGGKTIEVADGETPVPPPVMKEGFDFIGWEPLLVPASADATYTAQWQEAVPGVTWQITFDAAGGTGGETIEVADGAMPVPPDVEKEGFDFIGWEPLLVPAGADATYTAQWQETVPGVTWQITFDAAGGTGGGTIEVADGETPMPPAVEKEGFDFIGWEPLLVPAAGDATYTAQWKEAVPGVTWQITFDAASGTGGGTIEVADGETPVPPAVEKEGFDFIGWEPLLVPATGDATYTAQWQEAVPGVTWQITFDAAGGTGGKTIDVEDGETPVPPTVEKEGFDFIGWEPLLVPATADATYTAQWKAVVPKTWQITFDAAGGTGGETIDVEDGAMPVPPPVMKEGYDFAGWQPSVVPATGDATYTAQWQETAPAVTWQITFDADGGTGGKTIDVEDGETPVPPTVEKEGFDFIGWEPLLVPATADATYTAQWQEAVPGVTWQITFDAAGGTGGETIEVADGAMPMPPPVMKEGYDFAGWEPSVVPATEDATYTAQWQETAPAVTWQITFDAAGGTGGETIDVEDGAMPVPPVVIKEGYVFTGWEPSVVPAAADATYTAQWEKTVPVVTWQITFDANGGTGGKTIEVAHGVMPAPPVVAKEGYVFAGWEPALSPATTNASYKAKWTAVPGETTTHRPEEPSTTKQPDVPSTGSAFNGAAVFTVLTLAAAAVYVTRKKKDLVK